MDKIFTKSPLPSELKAELTAKNLWTKSCPVPLERLNLLTITYKDFEGLIHNDGQMIVLDAVADATLAIFSELLDINFPIAKIRLISEYNGSDELSMKDNNSSCFNFRQIAGSDAISIHSYGLAIDINPIQNPCLSILDDQGNANISPILGAEYLNRSKIRPGMVEPIVDIFKEHGFDIWGGNWNTPIDWQHFQLPRNICEKLALLPAEEAILYFHDYTLT